MKRDEKCINAEGSNTMTNRAALGYARQLKIYYVQRCDDDIIVCKKTPTMPPQNNVKLYTKKQQ